MPRHPPCALTILTVISNGSAKKMTRPVIPVPPPGSSKMKGNTSARPALDLIGHVAAVQFSRAAERCARGDSSRSAVSQNSTACTGSSSTICGALRRQRGNSHMRAPAGPARFGRRTRPYGRRTSHRFPPRAPEGAGRRPAMSPCRRGPIKGLPRKEVIQPQLPLRLPCYDFTPVTSPTFDGSLPCGLGHRLRVLLTPVV